MTAVEGTESVPNRPTNPLQRIVGVLFSPGETFRDIARKPDWIVPFLLILAISIAGAFIVSRHLDLETSIRAQMEERKVPAEQADRAVEMAKKFQQFSAAIVVVWVPAMFLVIAGVLLIAAKVLGGEGGFGQMFSVALYSWVPQLIKSIISMAIIAPKGLITQSEIMTLVRSNLGFLADPKEHAALFTALAAIDVFTLWTVILLIIGTAAASRLSRGKTTAIVVTFWLIFVLFGVGMAAMRGGMA